VGRMAISHLSDTRQDIGRRYHNTLLTKRVRQQGFVILDYQSKLLGAFLRLSRWIRDGKIQTQEDVFEGIDQVPSAFFRILEGKNNGKQLVKLAEIDHKLDPTPRWLGRMLISKWFPTEWLAKKITGLPT